MAILKGAMGYTRFFMQIKSALDPNLVAEKLNLFRFRELHEHGEDNESLGFSPYLWEYDPEKEITTHDFLYDKNIILSMRFDSVSLPRDLLKTMVRKSINSYQKAHQKMPDRVLRKEIEMAEAQALRARVLPKTKILEAIWLKGEQELKIFSRSAGLVEKFIELFQQTFLLSPKRLDFTQKAILFGQKHAQAAAVEYLSHQPIFAPPIRIDVQ